MKTIYTRKKEEILVDDDDFDYLNQWNWYITRKGYAARTEHGGKSGGGGALIGTLIPGAQLAAPLLGATGALAGWFAGAVSAANKVISKVDKTIFLHRIVNKTPEGLVTDHINRNKTDNRKENLRSATNTTNQRNRGLQKNNTSGESGISWHSQNNKWWVRIYIGKKTYSFGCFLKIEDAIKAKNDGIKKLNKTI